MTSLVVSSQVTAPVATKVGGTRISSSEASAAGQHSGTISASNSASLMMNSSAIPSSVTAPVPTNVSGGGVSNINRSPVSVAPTLNSATSSAVPPTSVAITKTNRALSSDTASLSLLTGPKTINGFRQDQLVTTDSAISASVPPTLASPTLVSPSIQFDAAQATITSAPVITPSTVTIEGTAVSNSAVTAPTSTGVAVMGLSDTTTDTVMTDTASDNDTVDLQAQFAKMFGDSATTAAVEEESDADDDARTQEQTLVSNVFGNDDSQDSNATQAQDNNSTGAEESQAFQNAKQEQAKREQQAEQRAQQQELAQIRELEKRDAEVTAHEQAHATVGGQFARNPSFQYEQGPDGRRYAVEGEVPIDLAPVPGDPLATLTKMQQVYAAAMAPVEPSPTDIRIATEALKQMTLAKQELAEERQSGMVELDTIEMFINADILTDPSSIQVTDELITEQLTEGEGPFISASDGTDAEAPFINPSDTETEEPTAPFINFNYPGYEDTSTDTDETTSDDDSSSTDASLSSDTAILASPANPIAARYYAVANPFVSASTLSSNGGTLNSQYSLPENTQRIDFMV